MILAKFDPVSQCSICGNDFPESEMTRHYRTGRLVDPACADEMTASDYLAIYHRPREDRRRARQPVPASENSTGPETRALSLFPRLVHDSNCIIVTSFGAGTGPSVSVAGSLDTAIVGILAGTAPVIGVVWDLIVLFPAVRTITGLTAAPVTENTRTLLVNMNLLNNLGQPRFTLSTVFTPLTAGEYYEWEYTVRY